jgi:peptidoglycan/LPS O-acetylase OafA/YrhL
MHRLAIPFLALTAFLGLALFKQDLFDAWGIKYATVTIYHAARLLAFGIFLGFLFRATYASGMPRAPTLGRYNDAYDALRKRYDPLLGLRMCAFLLVFLGHWFMVVFPPVSAAQVKPFFSRALLSGSPWGGVWVFFTLSGYLMGKGFVTERYAPNPAGLKTFYVNRILRIVPLYLLSLFLIVLLQRQDFLLPLSSPTQFDNALSELLFDSHGSGPIGALWSISTEAQFYIAIPFLHALLARYLSSPAKLVTAALLFVALMVGIKTYCLVIKPTFWLRHIYYPTLANMDCFLTGYAAAALVNLMRRQSFYLHRGMALGVVLAAGYYVLLSYASYANMMRDSSLRLLYLGIFPGLTAVVTATAIVLFETARRVTAGSHAWSRQGWRAQTMLGTLTYALYVWHEPVLLSFRSLFGSTLSLHESLGLMPIGFFLCITTAYIFYDCVERRFDRMRSSSSAAAVTS